MSETLDEIWDGDLLDRRKDADFLQKFLIAKSEQKKGNPESPSFVLNIDQSWGAGKTFFLKRFKQQLETEGHISCYINAWEDDFSEDPIVPILSALDEQLLPPEEKATKARKSFAKAARIIGKHLMHGIIRKTVAISVSEMTDELGNDNAADAISEASEELAEKSAHDIIDRFRENKQHINEFKEAFACVASELAENGSKSPLFILIDELDRCRPTYAIALLERIKHLFSVEDVVFVLTTDKDQLSHSICAVYGQKFDSSKYLDRFFDATYHFTEPSTESFVKYCIKSLNINLDKCSTPFDDQIDKEFFISSCAHAYSLSPRDIEKFMDILSSITSFWDFKSKIELLYLIPLILSAHLSRNSETKHLSELNSKAWLSEWKSHSNGDTKDFQMKHTTKNLLGRNTPSTIKFTDAVSTFMQMAKNPINKMTYPKNESREISRWIYKVFREELQNDDELKKGVISISAQDIRSRIIKYPEYVRHARLLSTE